MFVLWVLSHDNTNRGVLVVMCRPIGCSCVANMVCCLFLGGVKSEDIIFSYLTSQTVYVKRLPVGVLLQADLFGI